MIDAAYFERELSSHQHIALDFDDCLFDGPYSRLLTDYMAAHPEKLFSIITNRPGSREQQTIAEAVGLLLRRGISHDFKYAHIIVSPDSALCGDTVDIHFKGKAAARIGASILLDDDAIHQEGVLLHQIEFLHLPCAESLSVHTGW